MTSQPPQENDERREYARYPTQLSVDWGNDDNFLFSYITNISEMGIFIRSDSPAPVGTHLELRFGTDDAELKVEGIVTWVNPVREELGGSSGMGVRFAELTTEQRDRLVRLVRAIAYLDDENRPSSQSN